METIEPPPGGKEFLEAAKEGDVEAMKPILLSNPALLSYNGKVRRLPLSSLSPRARSRDARACGARVLIAGLPARLHRPQRSALGRRQEQCATGGLAARARCLNCVEEQC